MSAATPRTRSIRIALVALVGGLLAVLPSPIAGAATGQLLFSCSGPGFGEPSTSYAFQAVVDTDLPATLPYGSERATVWTTQVVAPESFRSWAQAQGFTTLYAGARTQTALDGVAQPVLYQSTPGLAVPATAGSWTWNTIPATTQVPAASPGRHTFTFTGLEVTVAFHDANGPRLATTGTCVLDPAVPATDAVIDAYDVVAATTSTSLALKGDLATATVTSTGVAPAGTVTFSVAGTSVTSEVKAGKASAKLPSLRPGTHTVSAQFVPTNPGQLTSSTGTATYVAPRIPTTTTATAVHRPARRLVKAKASVAAKDPWDVSGRVTFVLKRNGRTIANATVWLSSRDVASKKFRKVRRRGRYVVVAKYLGTTIFEGSRDRVRATSP
jgi:hypothetical protein